MFLYNFLSLSFFQHGFKTKLFSSKKVKRPHWLDYSEEKYGTLIVADTKRILHILALLPPLVLTASLYFQQASRWVFQSRQMNGQVGNYTIKPDQVPLVNAISTAVFVPVCEYIVNPLLAKIKIRTNLQRVTLGMFCSASAFVIAAIVQFAVDRSEEKLHIVYQIPQHMVLAFGEVLVYVQFLQFAYTQAPREMKSVLQAFFSMVIGGGNLIVALIATTEIFASIAYEYLMFAGIVYVGMILFIILSMRYKYVMIETDAPAIEEKEHVEEIVKNGNEFLRHRNGSIDGKNIDDRSHRENYNTRL